MNANTPQIIPGIMFFITMPMKTMGALIKTIKSLPIPSLKYSIAIVRLISGIPPKIEQMQHVINDIIVKSKIYIRP